MRSVIFFIVMLLLGSPLLAQTTYYSRNATNGGDWGDTQSWTTNSDGSGGPAASVPQKNDHVVILGGHTITVDDTDDNGSAGERPNNVNDPDNNIAPFNSSNSVMFYHTGNITINNSGSLDFTVSSMLRGETIVNGAFTTDNDDFVNLGRLEVASGATFDVGDDFILSGNSESVINNAATSVDDIYLDHSDAMLCGTGSFTILQEIQVLNGADPDSQICNGFMITCTDGDCNCSSYAGCNGGYYEGVSNFTLPVDLIYFNASEKASTVLLTWATASELNNDHFIIERSADGKIFEEIGIINGAGNSQLRIDYTFKDINPLPGTSYYRLKQTDFDGQYEHLGIVHADTRLSENIVLYPNPVDDQLHIFVSGIKNFSAYLEVHNAHGTRMITKQVEANNNIISINDEIPELSKGIYFVQIDFGNQSIKKRFIKQ